MRFCRILLLLLVTLPYSNLLRGQSTELMPLRILSYNIRHGAGMDDVVNLERQAAVINGCEPDIVGLQEVDSIVPRSGNVNEAGRLGTLCGMYATFGPAIPLSNGKYGVAVLSKEKPLSVTNIPLPGVEKRTLLVCEFEQYVFACTHLDLDASNRLASVPIILEEAKRWTKPFLICGDWNDKPTSELITQMKKNFTLLCETGAKGYSYPADNPTACIDYVATLGRTAMKLNSTVINEPVASDHRPLLVNARVRVATSVSAPLAPAASAATYDLSGRPVAGRQPRGVFVKKGRKFLGK